MRSRAWLVVAVVALSLRCGGNPCQEAIGKYNECMQKADPDGYVESKFAGTCNDEVRVGSDQVVAFRSWSDRYLACDVDPSTCECPGLGPWESYSP